MPEHNNKKKGSKKQQEQNVSINVEGQEEQALRNHDQEKLPEGKGQEEGRTGVGLLKGIVNFIKGIANAIFDMPQQEQSGDRDKKYKEDPIQPESVLQGDWLETLSPQAKLEAQEEGKRLKEGLKRSDAGNQSVGIKSPDHTPPETQQEKSEKQIG